MDVSKLIKKASAYQKVDEKRIKMAFDFARKAHAGQTRMSGKPYIIHPFEVTMLLTDYKADEDSIIAALLHDVVEDTYHQSEEIEKMFGKSVAKMVAALTKLPRLHVLEPSPLKQFDYKIESIRKIFEVMQEDVRVIVIKLCDRLHNMSTLHHFRPDKRVRIAKETMDIFVKIADRLCIYDLKEKLEELSFKYIYPDHYATLNALREHKSDVFLKNRSRILSKIALYPHLKNIKEVVVRRVIPFSRIIRSNFQELAVDTEVSVIVPNEEDCYLAVRAIHGLWKNIRGSFYDYISLKKSNDYQALQTSIIKKDGSIIKFVIQTQAMYDYSRYGVSLKCFAGTNTGKKIALPWLDNLKRIHKETKGKSSDYMTALEKDLLEEYITVYLTGNRTISLPARSTVLDAAFHAYGTGAYKLKRVLLNTSPASLYVTLKQNDTLQCFFGAEDQVIYEWLDWVDTTLSVSYIKEKLQKSDKSKNLRKGRSLLEAAFEDEGKGFFEEVDMQNTSGLLKKFGLDSFSDLYRQIGEGSIDPSEVAIEFQKSPTSKKSRMLLEVKGPLQHINDFYKALLQEIPHGIKHRMKGSGEETVLRLSTEALSPQQWKKISLVLERFDKVTLLKKEKFYEKKAYLIISILITVLWGFDPVIAHQFLNNGISPYVLTISRFFFAALLLFPIVALRQKGIFQRWFIPKKLPFWSWENLFLSISLFSVALFTYLSLQETTASLYLLGIFATFFFIVNYTTGKNGSRKVVHFFSWVILSGFLLAIFLFDESIWPQQARIWTALAVLSFSAYTLLGNMYQAKLKVFARYDQLQLNLSIYCVGLSLLLLFVFDWPALSLSQDSDVRPPTSRVYER